jgi:hypothetical protein
VGGAFGALMNIILIWMQDMEIHVHLILGAVLASILGAVIFLSQSSTIRFAAKSALAASRSRTFMKLR